MFKTVLKVTTDVVKWADKKKKASRKAMSLAMSKASFQLMKDAQMDLKTGRLGLKRLSYMSDQSDPRFGGRKARRGKRTAARLAKSPLTGLFRGITYYVDRQRLRAEVGFRGIGGTAWQARIAEKSFEGYSWRYSDRARETLHRIGVHLQPATSSARVPPRDVMSAVMEKYERKYFKSINALYLRKMAGERI